MAIISYDTCMHRYMYKSIHMAIWNGCHIRQYSINFDWCYWLSFLTELELTIFWSYHRSLTPHPPKNPPGHKTSIYCISGQKLQLDLTFNSWFSNIHWYYRIHVVTFPYLSELPPNMNEWMNAEVIHSDDCSLGQNMITAYWMPPDWDHLKTL